MSTNFYMFLVKKLTLFCQDLRAINNMIQVDGSRKVCKRLLADDSADEASLPKIAANDAVSRKLHSIISDRVGQA